jgi:hypothetical protein
MLKYSLENTAKEMADSLLFNLKGCSVSALDISHKTKDPWDFLNNLELALREVTSKRDMSKPFPTTIGIGAVFRFTEMGHNYSRQFGSPNSSTFEEAQTRVVLRAIQLVRAKLLEKSH